MHSDHINLLQISSFIWYMVYHLYLLQKYFCLCLLEASLSSYLRLVCFLLSPQRRRYNLKVFLSLLEHFLSKSGGDCTFIHQFIECQSEYTAFITFTKKSVLYRMGIVIILLRKQTMRNFFKKIDYIGFKNSGPFN